MDRIKWYTGEENKKRGLSPFNSGSHPESTEITENILFVFFVASVDSVAGCFFCCVSKKT